MQARCSALLMPPPVLRSPTLTVHFLSPQCRVADTRNADGPFGGPELAPKTSREFNATQVILDINGYFVPASTPSALACAHCAFGK